MAGVDVAGEKRKRALTGVGRVVIWPGGSLWVGRRMGQVQQHAHHAIQISLALEGRFQIQSASWPQPQQATGAVVMPDQPHGLDGCEAMLALLFVEPNSLPGAALRKRFSGHHLALLSAAESEAAVNYVRQAYLRNEPDSQLAQFAKGAICRIAGNPGDAPASDPRITAALAWMRSRLALPMRLDEVAKAVHLSPGRFRHLFVAQTGTSFRAWLLWARAEHAIAAATRGMSWSDAAMEAGFADAAHFTRTCRRVFGIAPTMLAFEKAE